MTPEPGAGAGTGPGTAILARDNPGHYLDTATYGLPARATVQACAEALEAWRDGRASWVEDWDVRGERCRALYAEAAGVPAGRVALMPSASVGVGIVAWSLPAGSRVLVAREDFTSVLFPFLERERAARDLDVEAVALADLPARVDGGVDLVAVSHVQSASGRMVDAGALLDRCRGAGARLLLDVTQAVGSLPREAAWREADYTVAAAYKWLCCPRGVAFLSAAPGAGESLVSLAANWRGGEDPYDSYYGPPLRLAAGVRRLDVSLAWHAWAGASVALEEFAVPDGVLAARREHTRGLLDALCEATGAAATGSGIVSMAVDPGAGVAARLRRRGVRAAVRAGRLRVSLHAYNTRADVEALLECLDGAVVTCTR